MIHDSRGYSILIADADERLAMLTARFLDAYGVSTRIVSDGWSAQSEVEHVSYTCLVLSMELPRMSGIETCKAIRASSQVPIIVFGSAAGSSAVLALLAGADDFVRKPFSPRELLARIVTIVRRRRATAPPLVSSR